MGLILGGGGREQQKKTGPNLCQPDRHFLPINNDYFFKPLKQL